MAGASLTASTCGCRATPARRARSLGRATAIGSRHRARRPASSGRSRRAMGRWADPPANAACATPRSRAWLFTRRWRSSRSATKTAGCCWLASRTAPKCWCADPAPAMTPPRSRRWPGTLRVSGFCSAPLPVRRAWSSCRDEPADPGGSYPAETAEVPMFLRRIAALIGLFFGIVASQVPEYAQQYRQRLGGAIDELNALIAGYDANATQSGKTREDAISGMQKSEDRFAQVSGDQMRDTIARRN